VDSMRRPILNHTKRGEIVYEPFPGSGTTLAAVEVAERISYGTELEPKYADVIVQRWQTLSGKKAKLDGDGRTFDVIADERKQGPRQSNCHCKMAECRLNCTWEIPRSTVCAWRSKTGRHSCGSCNDGWPTLRHVWPTLARRETPRRVGRVCVKTLGCAGIGQDAEKPARAGAGRARKDGIYAIR
jgi:hypothetical protein